MRQIISDGHRARMVQVAAQLGIADVLGEDAKPIEFLAGETGTDPNALTRLLRALAASGIFVEHADRTWSLTALGQTLREGGPGSTRMAALYWGLDSIRAAWSDLLYSIRTGQPSFQRVNGLTFFDHMADCTEDGQIFDRFMTLNTQDRVAAYVAAIDWTGFRHVIDVGGGEGALMAALLTKNPNLSGTVFDLPKPAFAARLQAVAHGLHERLNVIEGNFFDDVPSGADAYILSSILHDWPDETASAILGTCRRAMRPGASLIVIEQVLDAPAPQRRFSAELDVAMLVLLGGRERRRSDFADLFQAAGFDLVGIAPTATSFSVITAQAVC
jgi:hypothetical protein